jgi:N-acetylneuraminic acid mutarotase
LKTATSLKAGTLLLLTLWSPFVRGQGKWVGLAPFPDPREEVMGEAANGRLYVFSGLIPLWHPAGLVYEYDPATNQWTKKKPMALPSHHVAFCEHDCKIYAFGGFV